MKETEVEARLVRGIKRMGGAAFKFVSPGCAGVPDRLVVLPGGRVIFVELKADGGRLSPLQAARILHLRELGAQVCVLRGASEVDGFLAQCREGGGAK